MNLSKGIHSLCDFKQNTAELMKRMQESGEPMVLTVSGKARLIVQDAASYQKLLESLDYDQAVIGIRQGLDDVKAGRTQPVAKFARSTASSGRPAREIRRRVNRVGPR